MNVDELRLQKIRFECEQHISKLSSAHRKLKPLFPLTLTVYQGFNDDTVSYLDQYLYRFSKLQDSIGQKLFKAVLAYKKEEVSSKPFIDIVNRLEQLHYINDVDGWFELRNIRNQLAHDYEDNSVELIVILNNIFAMKERLESYYFSIVEKL